MTAKGILRTIIDMLVRAGKIPTNATGQVVLTINLNQGGMTNAEIGFTERV